jgi:hypothetical protein
LSIRSSRRQIGAAPAAVSAAPQRYDRILWGNHGEFHDYGWTRAVGWP